MAFKNGLDDRMDELRFPTPRSPLDDSSPFSGYTSPPRGQTNFMSSFGKPSSDTRANLQRRFTTDASKMSSLSAWSMGGSPFGAEPEPTQTANQLHKSQLLEKKRQHIEYMREQKRRFEETMKMMEMQHEQEMARDLGRLGLGGPVSEPTTPPEYRDGFPTALSRPSRFSMSNITSPPGIFGRFSSQVTSPSSTQPFSARHTFSTHNKSAKSMPGSRRDSNGEDSFPTEELPTYQSPNTRTNRYSMPLTGMATHSRTATASRLENFGFGNRSANNYHFSEQDEKNEASNDNHGLSNAEINSILQLTDPDDKFPTLSRRDNNSGLLSANSAAVDLANEQTSESWAPYTHHRPSHQSLPQNVLQNFRFENQLSSPPGETQTVTSAHQSPGSGHRFNRHSVEISNFSESSRNDQPTEAAPSASRPTALQSSYSMNDIPTVKNANNFNFQGTPARDNASQQFHNHNASLGRIPPNAVPNHRSREMSISSITAETVREEPPVSTQPTQSSLQASAAPFGPQLVSSVVPGGSAAATTGNPMAYANPAFYGYGLFGMGNMSNGLPAGNMSMYQPQGGYPGPQQFPVFTPSRQETQPARNGQQRRNQNNEEVSRFSNMPLEHFQGQLLSLCTDQHGCRYLQRKLEERNPDNVSAIFAETNAKVVELMTDPFGNYLCQKLLEFSNDEQRTTLVNNAAPQMVKIALNQHGTRALQKMIEFISTPEQIQIIVRALSADVVDLVKDLNGNHVIQKCLNRLAAEDAQFIYNAVGANCVTVGTHRHGCCVLQRCIDHASVAQKSQLIQQITDNAYVLVQDPYGNYVVQYILDLGEAQFIEPLCILFRRHIPALSKQKFSSNVIEKCIRTAPAEVRRMLIEDMLNSPDFDKMVRDSYANYVVQTAIDYADPLIKARLIEAISPILPSIRQTPHGRRIASKVLGEGAGRLSGNSSGQVTPHDSSSGQIPSAAPKNPAIHQPRPRGGQAENDIRRMMAGAMSTEINGGTFYPSTNGNGIQTNGNQAQANQQPNGDATPPYNNGPVHYGYI